MKNSVVSLEIIPAALSYEFTDDKSYLRQYAELVIAYYKKELDLDLVGDDMAADLDNPKSNERIFVARDGDKVIAGAKITLGAIATGDLLPMESEDFRVSEILPERYGDHSYAEIGRLVVDPEYRGKDVLAKIITALAEFTAQQGGGYLFVMAPPINAVLYKRVCRTLAMEVTIHKEYAVACKDAYSHLQLQLVSCDIRKFVFPVEKVA